MGLGFFLGSILSLLYALQVFDKIIENLNYTTFYFQNFALKERGKKLNKFIKGMNKDIYLRWHDKYLKLALFLFALLLIILSYQFLK